MENLIFSVAENEQGERLDRFVAARAPELSRNRIKSLAEQGLVMIDGEIAKVSRKLKTGQRIDVVIPEPEQTSLEPDENVFFEILYQDKDIVVINKPPGLVVHPAAGNWDKTLVHGLLAACPDIEGVGGEIRPGIVHRLDKDTSGVMVAAKNDIAHRRLVEDFKARRLTKTYLALCKGAPTRREGRIEAPIGRHPVKRKVMSVNSSHGKPAVTEYKTVAEFKSGFVLFQLKLLTGRTHQIRVHMAAAGLPILGDSIYGTSAGALKGFEELKTAVKRQMLHSFKLGFKHPGTGEEMNFEAPAPDDLANALRILKEIDNRK